MEVVGSDGQHVGTVDRLERGRMTLTREDDAGRAGEHRLFRLSCRRCVVEDQQARPAPAPALLRDATAKERLLLRSIGREGRCCPDDAGEEVVHAPGAATSIVLPRPSRAITAVAVSRSRRGSPRSPDCRANTRKSRSVP
jgi:hypothetical protein